MYIASVVLLMIVLPVVSILTGLANGSADLVVLVGKWYVFWASGIRLLAAGLTQVFRPAFTAQTILGIKDPEASKVVSELGFANIAIGLICTLSLLFPQWILPGALASGLFYGLAGAKHLVNSGRNIKENLALATDVLAFVVLAFVVAEGLARGAA